MTIHDGQGRNLLQIWKSQQAVIRAEFSAGNISVWFTGNVSSYSITELVLSRGNDEVSISLFSATYRLIEPDPIEIPDLAAYRRVVVVTTDANTTCTLYELRDRASL